MSGQRERKCREGKGAKGWDRMGKHNHAGVFITTSAVLSLLLLLSFSRTTLLLPLPPALFSVSLAVN
ncbi:hypothetical protein K402DRAFT_170395 [Aulographum hederae CBS 113979]|uniref:Uncharacterized protein n=1 Tax=Aulographum hederae CBS 113979 TaxID=1176131 RepID=A0A6G1HCX8_9PEZI|nr:hypothetical protein K402DRAFT_170395 [Aulographum hederae CBS 113979]